MKSQMIKATLVSAFVLASPILSFAAAGAHLIRVPSKDEVQSKVGVTRAVQPGKGSMVTRNQEVQANAYREQTASESQVTKDQSRTGSQYLSDKALRK